MKSRRKIVGFDIPDSPLVIRPVRALLPYIAQHPGKVLPPMILMCPGFVSVSKSLRNQNVDLAVYRCSNSAVKCESNKIPVIKSSRTLIPSAERGFKELRWEIWHRINERLQIGFGADFGCVSGGYFWRIRVQEIPSFCADLDSVNVKTDGSGESMHHLPVDRSSPTPISSPCLEAIEARSPF